MTIEDDGGGRRQRLRQRYPEAVLELMTDADVVDGRFDAAVRSITETAADIVGATRVSIWLFDDDGDRVQCVDRYDRRTGDHDAGMELIASEYPAYFEALHSHRSISAVDARTDSRTRELAADYLDPQGIDSLLDATLRVEGDVIGVVCHEQIGHRREWTDAEIQFAGDVADVVHRALRNHRSAEQRRELEFRRSLLEAQQEAMPDGVFVVGDDHEILSCNSRFCELWGLSRAEVESADEVLSRVREQLVEPDAFVERIDRLAEDPDETDHDEIVLDDGRVFEVYSTPVRGADASGTRYGRLWIVRDISERRARQEELELTRRTMDEAPIGITVTDSERETNPAIYANDRFEDLTGYARDEISSSDFRMLHGDGTASESIEELYTAVEEERPTTVELRNYRKDGSEFWNRVTIAPVTDEDGTVTNYVGFQQDVTERKEATRQLRVLHRVLRHNLANQLSIVRGTAEQLAGQAVESVETAAETIVQETDRLLAFTDKHRKIVSLLSDRPAPEPIELEPLLDRLVGDLRTEYPDAEIRLEGEPSTTVVAIPTLETAIRELLTNGIVYSDRESPAVTLRVDRRPETVRIRIVDNGPGLPDEEARILTGDQSVEPLYHGLGMGLWLVYWIARLSRGTITVEESGPAGTVLRLELPRKSD